jgi:hypothetical protein
VTIADLPGTIEKLASAGTEASRDEARQAFATLRAALAEGTARAAEPDASAPSGWKVNAWVKRGILLGFRFGETIDMSADHGRWPFFDKDTLPLKKVGAWSAVRIVPGGSTIRDGAYLGRGVICMHPCTSTSAPTSATKRSSIRTPSSDRARRSAAGVASQRRGAESAACSSRSARCAGHRGRRSARRRQLRRVRGHDRESRAGAGRRHHSHGFDPRLRSAERPRDRAGGRAAARHPPRGRRRARDAAGDDRTRPRMGSLVSTPIIVKYRDERTSARTALETWIR